MGAILSLWEDPTSYWDDLPPELQTKIYRDTQAERTLAAERYANAPGGWKHWLRTSAIGPAILDRVNNHESFHHINDNAKSLMLKDIVSVIRRFETVRGIRPSILPVEIRLQNRDIPTPGMTRIMVRFFIDWEGVGHGPNEWGPWLTGRWLTPDEYE